MYGQSYQSPGVSWRFKDAPTSLETACEMAANVSSTSDFLSDKGKAQFKKLWSSMQALVREELVIVLDESLYNAQIEASSNAKMAVLLDLLGFVQDSNKNLVMITNSSITDICRNASLKRFRELADNLKPEEVQAMKSIFCDLKKQLKRDMPSLMNAWMMKNLGNIAFSDEDMEVIKQRFNPFLQKFFSSAMQNGPTRGDECGRY
jgi:hypothetical protein